MHRDSRTNLGDVHRRRRRQLDLELLSGFQAAAQDEGVAAPDQLEPFGDADALDGVELTRQALQVGRRDIAAGRIEAADVAMQKRLSQRWSIGHGEEAGFRRRADRVVDGVDQSLQNGHLVAGALGDRGEVVDRAGVELRQQRADSIAQKTRIAIRAVAPRRDRALP